jgi:hypothetical protein
MSFLKSPAIGIDEAAAVNAALMLNNDFVLNYDNMDYITNVLMLDNINPILDYDMSRYVDENFIKARYFFHETMFHFDVYGDYLRTLVDEYGKTLDAELYGT